MYPTTDKNYWILYHLEKDSGVLNPLIFDFQSFDEMKNCKFEYIVNRESYVALYNTTNLEHIEQGSPL